MKGDVVVSQDLFLFRQSGLSPEGRVLGSFQPTGIPARLFQELRAAGIEADFGLFQGA